MLGSIVSGVFEGLFGKIIIVGVSIVLAGAGGWWWGKTTCSLVHVKEVAKLSEKLNNIRAGKVEIEKDSQAKLIQLRKELGEVSSALHDKEGRLYRLKKDDLLHRQYIDNLKKNIQQLQERGCVLDYEELMLHPLPKRMYDNFLGRVR